MIIENTWEAGLYMGKILLNLEEIFGKRETHDCFTFGGLVHTSN